MCARQNPNQFNPLNQANPNSRQPSQSNQIPQQPPRRQEPQYKFRWPIFIGLPIVVLAFFWFVSGMEVVFSFSDVTEALDIVFADRFVLLTCLGVGSVTVLLIIKTVRR